MEIVHLDVQAVLVAAILAQEDVKGVQLDVALIVQVLVQILVL